MQTSAINYRVADFLKQYPPFQGMELEDLLDLASRGRVKFHEIDEYILWQDAPHGPYVFVIQQGTVSLWLAGPRGDQLWDMRGPGDVVGIDRFHGLAANAHSCKAASDVVLYALPADTFAKLLEKYPQAQRYIAAHSSVTANVAPLDQRKGHHETLLYEGVRPAEPAVCTPGNTVRQAARRMLRAGSQAIAVVDGDGRVAGVVTASGLLQAVAADGFDATQPVEELMDRAPVTLAPDVSVSHAALALGQKGVAAVTQGGQLRGLVTVDDLGPVFGDHPSRILLEIARAPGTDALRLLQQRARKLVLEHLTAPAAVDWLAEFLHLTDGAILRRLEALHPAPGAGYCWCLYGAAGRAEALSPVIQRAVLLLDAGVPGERFAAWYEQMQTGLGACGYVVRPPHFEVSYSCAPVEEWRKRYAGWIEDPIQNSLHHARHLFDLRPALGDAGLWRGLEESLKEVVRANPAFVRLLANDCFSSLPPLTFFRDAVVGESGETSQVFRLEKEALRPLVDVGRVFGIAAGRVLGASTLERFRMARTLLPEHEAIFREASETLRVVLLQQGRSGIRHQNGGTEVLPAELSHYDRQLLKSGFRSIHRLLEFTADGDWLEAA